MKTKILISIILFITVATISVNANYGGCVPCDQPTMLPVSRIITIPQFPSCSLWVDYWIMTCPGSNKHYYVGLTWGIWNNGIGCDDFIRYFIHVGPNGVTVDFAAYQQLIFWVFDEVSLLDFEGLNQADFPCPSYYYTASYTQPACVIYNIVAYEDPPGSGNWKDRCSEVVSCNETGCCEYTDQYCWDNGQLTITKIDNNSSILCTNPPNPPPIFNCLPTQPGDIQILSPCTFSCLLRIQ